MLPRIRAMTSPTRSEKAINETAPIAIHTHTDISQPPLATGSKLFPARAASKRRRNGSKPLP
jgi:hypothetical protein